VIIILQAAALRVLGVKAIVVDMFCLAFKKGYMYK